MIFPNEMPLFYVYTASFLCIYCTHTHTHTHTQHAHTHTFFYRRASMRICHDFSMRIRKRRGLMTHAFLMTSCNVCVYVCMYVFRYVCMYFVYVHMYCMYVFRYVCIDVSMRIWKRKGLMTHTFLMMNCNVCVCVCVCVYLCVQVCMYLFMHLFMYV